MFSFVEVIEVQAEVHRVETDPQTDPSYTETTPEGAAEGIQVELKETADDTADINDETIEDELSVVNVYEEFMGFNPVKKIERELTLDLELTQRISTWIKEGINNMRMINRRS